MPLSPIALAPPQMAVGPGATPRPDLRQAAGSAALTYVAPDAMSGPAVAAPVVDQAYHMERVQEFEDAEFASRPNREKAERDVDYYDNKQLTEKEFAALMKRGQPPITLNMIRQKIDYLIGLERTSRTKPRALPRTQRHEEDASSASDALVYVAQDNRFDQVRSRVWTDLLKTGWGGTQITAEPVPNPQPGQPAYRIVIKRCAWDRMWWDPFSAEEDFEDANHRGLVLWMDRDDAIRTYGPMAGQVFDETISMGEVGGSYDDRPKYATWVQTGKRRRMRVVQEYFRGADGQWNYCEFTKGGVLKAGPSPWRNALGEGAHPYEWRSAYIDRDNNRYGVIRDLIDPQDEINKRRSKALHHYTTRQTFGTPEATGPQSIAEMRKELARPDGHVSLPAGAEWGKNFGIIPTNDQAQGHETLLTQAMQVFETMGPNATMMGIKKGDLSGRSVLAQQQGGQIQQGSLTDTLRDLDIGTYRKAWNGVRQFWSGETWVRVTDNENNLKWVGFNKPAMQPVLAPVFDPAAPGGMGGQQPIIDPQTGQPAMQPVIDPMTGQPVLQNAVAELDVDILIDDAPDAGTMLDEQFALILQLKQLDKNDEIPFSAIVSAAPNLRNKADLLKAIQQREQAPPDPVKVAGVQSELQNKQADTEHKAAQAVRARALAAQTLAQTHLATEQPILDAQTHARDLALEAHRIEQQGLQAAAQAQQEQQQAPQKPPY